MNPQLQAEDIANEHGACLEHAGGNIWVARCDTRESAEQLRDAFRRIGFGASAGLHWPTQSTEVTIDLTEAMAEYRASL